MLVWIANSFQTLTSGFPPDVTSLCILNQLQLQVWVHHCINSYQEVILYPNSKLPSFSNKSPLTKFQGTVLGLILVNCLSDFKPGLCSHLTFSQIITVEFPTQNCYREGNGEMNTNVSEIDLFSVYCLLVIYLLAAVLSRHAHTSAMYYI